MTEQEQFNKWESEMSELLKNKHGWSVLIMPFETRHDISVGMFLDKKTPEQAADLYHRNFKASFN